MPTPSLPLVAYTGSVSVQNQRDAAGNMHTYFAFRVPGGNCQLQFGNTDVPVVVFEVVTASLSAFTASVSASLANASITGSW